MKQQTAISVKVYDDILERFDAILSPYEKRNQAINKALEIYIDLIKTRATIDQESENIGEATAMMADYYKRACVTARCWRTGSPHGGCIYVNPERSIYLLRKKYIPTRNVYTSAVLQYQVYT